MDALAFNLQGFLVMHVSVSFFQEGPHLRNEWSFMYTDESRGISWQSVPWQLSSFYSEAKA